MTKKITIILGVVIAILVGLLFVHERNNRLARKAILAEVRPIVADLSNARWETVSQEANSALLCRLELAVHMWGDVNSLLQKSAELGTPISFSEIGQNAWQARYEVHDRFVTQLLKAFDSGTKVRCSTNADPENVTEKDMAAYDYGRNSYTLTRVADYLGKEEGGVHERTMSLAKELVGRWRADKNPDILAESLKLAEQFEIPTWEIGLTAEEVGQYNSRL